MPPEKRMPGSPNEWLRRARGNLARVSHPKREDEFWEDYCFDVQQASEKALKAVLVYRKVDFPKTHDLSELLALIRRVGITIPQDVTACETLSAFAVQTRYPGTEEPVTEAEFQEALKLAQICVRWAEGIIGSGKEEL